MSSEKLIEIAKEVAALHVESICLCGGEPVIRINDVLDMIAEIKTISPCTGVAMVSNGLLWSNKIATDLRKRGLDAVQFSLDGMSDESYDYIRGTGGNRKKVLEAIEMAKNAGFDIMIVALPHRLNYAELDSYIEFCGSHLAITELRMQPLMPLGRGEHNYESIVLDDGQYLDVKLRLQKASSLYPKTKFEWGYPLDHMFMLQEMEYMPMIDINAYGEVRLSPYLPITIWNIANKPLEEYIRCEGYRRVLKHPLVKATSGRADASLAARIAIDYEKS